MRRRYLAIVVTGTIVLIILILTVLGITTTILIGELITRIFMVVLIAFAISAPILFVYLLASTLIDEWHRSRVKYSGTEQILPDIQKELTRLNTLIEQLQKSQQMLTTEIRRNRETVEKLRKELE